MTRFRFVEAEAAQFPVSLLCRVVGVTRQGYLRLEAQAAERQRVRRPQARRADPRDLHRDGRDLRRAADPLGVEAR